MRPSQKRPACWWLVAVAVPMLLFTVACGPEATASSVGPQQEPAAALATATAPPPVVVTVAAPANRQSFSLSPTAPPVAQDVPTDSAAQVQEDEPPPAPPVISPEATLIPQPTYTLPAAPPTSEQDHYWFGRPVPQGGTVWTDKAYPYGSTKGDTLRPHHGVEFNVPRGTSVLAVADGTVRVAGSDASASIGPAPAFYGKVVVIEHEYTVAGKAIYTLYGHLSDVAVQIGQQVQANQVIGLSGASGVADGPHLHFEVRVGQNSYTETRNPLLWLYPFPDRGVVAGRVTWPDGSSAAQVPLQLRRLDAPSVYAATTTYAAGGVNGDDRWRENFAFDDVVAGFYELTVGAGANKQTLELWVYPYQTNFVEVELTG